MSNISVKFQIFGEDQMGTLRHLKMVIVTVVVSTSSATAKKLSQSPMPNHCWKHLQQASLRRLPLYELCNCAMQDMAIVICLPTISDRSTEPTLHLDQGWPQRHCHIRRRSCVKVGAVGAAAPTLFSERLFCTNRIILKPVKI